MWFRQQTSRAVSAINTVPYIGVDVNLVLPFELAPHASELEKNDINSLLMLIIHKMMHYLCLCAVCWVDVVHNINVDIVQYHHAAVFVCIVGIIDNVAKDDTGLCGRNFDRGLDGEERVRGKVVCDRSVHKLEVAQGGKLDCKVLKGFICLVDDQNI